MKILYWHVQHFLSSKWAGKGINPDLRNLSYLEYGIFRTKYLGIQTQLWQSQGPNFTYQKPAKTWYCNGMYTELHKDCSVKHKMCVINFVRKFSKLNFRLSLFQRRQVTKTKVSASFIAGVWQHQKERIQCLVIK